MSTATYDTWLATEQRRPGETPTGHLIRGLFASIALGLEEAGMPLTAEQRAFLDGAAEYGILS